MIQDIAPKKLHNEYMPKKPKANDYVAVFSKNKMLIKENGESLQLPRIQDMPSGLDLDACQYLFCIDQEAYFLYMNWNQEEAACGTAKAGVQPENRADGLAEAGIWAEMGLRFEKVSDLRYHAGKECCFAAYTAYHLYCWYRDNQFCGRCGRRVRPDQKERMLYCEHCGNQIYPKIAPAVIVAVTNGDKLLLTKYAGRAYTKYALIAGFTEIGETGEQTVQREVMEEVGLHVKEIRYYKTQPWGIDGNFLIGYFARLDGSDAIQMDKNELSAAEWVSRADLKDMDDGFSLTREMMRVFYENGGYKIW